MFKTYESTVNYIKDLFNNHNQIKEDSVFFGDPENLSIVGMNMPYVIIQPIPYQMGIISNMFKYRIYVFDLTDEDQSNYLNVLSDTKQIINDIFNKIMVDRDYEITNDISINPFSERFDDYVAGNWFDLTLISERNQRDSQCYENRNE